MRIENIVLATICKSESVCDRFFSTLSVDDFQVQENKFIFGELEKIIKKGGWQSNVIKGAVKASGWDYIDFISNSDEQNIDNWYLSLKEEVTMQRMAEQMHVLALQWGNKEGHISEFTDIQLLYNDVGEFSLNANDPSILNAISVLKETMAESKKYDKHYFEMSTFNQSIKYLHAGRVYVIAARPRIGKTTLAVQILFDRAKKGDPVAFVTGEMDKGEVVALLINQMTGIDYGRILANDLSSHEYDMVQSAMKKLESIPFYIIDETDFDLIISQLYALKQKYGIKGVAIDYLQILGLKGYKDATPRVSEISRRLKGAIKRNKLDVWLLELSQIGRAGNRTPTLQDLKDSGQIEQDADCVIILHSDYQANNQDPQYQENILELSIAKYRQFKFRGRPVWEIERSNFNKFGDIGRKEVSEVGFFPLGEGDDNLPF